MLNASSQIEAASENATHSPFKVDPFAGSHNGEVSMQWMSRPHDQRYTSLDDLHATLKARHERSFETRTASKKIELVAPEIKTPEDMHRLKVGVTIDMPSRQEVVEVSPTNYAFGQLCARAKAPAAFMRELPSMLVADTLNYRFGYDREVEELKLYGDNDELWAATGPEYGRIPDFQIVDALRNVAGDGRGSKRWKIPGVMDWRTHMYDPEAPVTTESTTLYASDRDVFCFLVDDRNPIVVGKTKDGDDDMMFRGFFLQNSEVGARALRLCWFYLRAVCMNRNLWGVEGFQELTIRHTRLAPERWLRQCVPALDAYVAGTADKLADAVAHAKKDELAADQKSAMEFLVKGRNYSRAMADAILKRGEEEEGRPVRSAWDFAQAITATARDIPFMDKRLDLERDAATILNKSTGVKTQAPMELEGA